MNTKIALIAFAAVYCALVVKASVIRDETLFDVSAPTRQRRIVDQEEEAILDVSAPTRQKRMADEDEDEDEELNDAPADVPHEKYNCTYPSKSGVENTFCAAHCLVAGKSSGYCTREVCYCRI